MIDEPSQEDLAKLPSLGSTEDLNWRDIVIHLHFKLGPCDWYAAEYDSQARTLFCFVVLNDDLANAAWEITSYDELRAMDVNGDQVTRDEAWEPKPAGTIPRIYDAYLYRRC